MSGNRGKIFKTLANAAHDGLILKPQIQNLFFSGEGFPDEFSVTFKKAWAPRKPDGYFHPSTHPTMPIRQLYYYLMASKGHETAWESEQLSYESRVSVLMGTAVHELIQAGTAQLGIMDKPSGTCNVCGKSQPDECGEHGVLDEVNKVKGHMDDVLLDGRGNGPCGIDYKTTSAKNLIGVDDNDLELFKRKWPYYYGQGQSYMMSTGLRTFIFLFIGFGHPWTMKEFVIPYDVEYCLALEQKYKKAREYAEREELPAELCCSGGAKAASCPASLCPVKRL